MWKRLFSPLALLAMITVLTAWGVSAAQGLGFDPSTQVPILTVDEYPIVAAEVDGPGHFENADRLNADILARIEGLRTYADEQELASANAPLAPCAGRLRLSSATPTSAAVWPRVNVE